MNSKAQAKRNVLRLGANAQRLLAIIVGCLCLALGMIGVFLPLLPSTPFFLVAVGCFASASPRLEAWLMSIDVVAAPVRAWRERGAIALPAKLMATLCMGLSLGAYAVSGAGAMALGAGAGLLMLCAIFIWTRPI
jgi:uncharacterized membrane protein YbaN (DUF454 family)